MTNRRPFLRPVLAVLVAAVLAGGAALPAPAAHAAPPSVTVVRGDTMSRIAARHHLSLGQLIRANPQVKNPNRIYPGQHLNLVGGSAAPAKSAPAKSFPKGRNTYPFGQCTFGAAALAHNNVNGLGNAKDWLWKAKARGMSVGSTPRTGATVVFAPGVQGASRLGHVAHVVRVNANGTFVIEEMNFFGLGGGFGKMSFRTVHAGAGVGFIY